MTKPFAHPRRLGAMHPPVRLLPFAFVLVIAACSASPAASTPPSAAAAPSLGPNSSLTVKPVGTADYSGTLAMDSIEGGCAYLQSADGKKYQVIYPEGWQLNKNPLELVAPDGSVHAKAGDTVSIKGSEADMASICQIGPIIQATEVLDR
jgi:hypothetical protein